MTLSGFALVLAAAFCHATWNVFVKRINGGSELIWLFSLVATILYFPAFVLVLVWQAPQFTWLTLVFLAGSTLLHLGYFVLLQAGYRKGDLSLVYPTARATGPLLSTGFAILFLSETISLQLGIGAALAVFGVFMLTGGADMRSRQVRTSLLFGIATGLFIGAYTVWDAYAVAVLLIPPLLVDYLSSVARVVLLTPLARRRRAKIAILWANHRLDVLAIAVFSPLAYILVLYALTFTPVAYVAPLREVSVVLAVLAGSLLLGEGHLKQRLGWAAVVLVGIALLATARV